MERILMIGLLVILMGFLQNVISICLIIKDTTEINNFTAQCAEVKNSREKNICFLQKAGVIDEQYQFQETKLKQYLEKYILPSKQDIVGKETENCLNQTIQLDSEPKMKVIKFVRCVTKLLTDPDIC